MSRPTTPALIQAVYEAIAALDLRWEAERARGGECRLDEDDLVGLYPFAKDLREEALAVAAWRDAVAEAYANLPYAADQATRPLVVVEIDKIAYVDTAFVQDCPDIGLAVDHMGFGSFKIGDWYADRMTDEARDTRLAMMRQAGVPLPKGWPHGRLHFFNEGHVHLPLGALSVLCAKADRTLLWIEAPNRP